MQIIPKNSHILLVLVLSLVAVVGIIFIANLISQDFTIVMGNLLYIPLTVSLVVLSIVMAIRFRGKSNHGIAWFLFAVCASSWMIAEDIYILEELVFHTSPFPSPADVFYLSGYVFLILFSINYLKVVKYAISKKIILLASLISIAIIIPSIYMTLQTSSDLKDGSLVLAFSYPIIDSIALVPAIIGLILFFRGEVNFLWTLFSFAIISLIIGDTGFLITHMDNSYHTGHPIEIMFYWSYILLSFGVYSHIKIFNTKKMTYHDKESLR